MKKLLALLLCVMLFVSVIPTSAFAAIDLSTAYDAMANLNNAYAKLAIATAGKNAVDGAKAYAELFDAVTNPNAHQLSLNRANIFVNRTIDKLQRLDRKGIGLSYKGVWDMWGHNIQKAYNRIAEGLVEDIEDTVDAKAAKIEADVTAEIAKLEASISTALTATLASMTIPTT